MAFNFTRPVTWLPGRIGGTRVTAERLNEMQDGIGEQMTEALGSVASASGALLALAADPESLVASLTTFDPATGIGTAGTVRWPDGATGTYTATVTASGVSGYVVTHVLGGTTITYTQPTMTRDSSGRVTLRPAITVT